MIGSYILNYKILKKIGEGGMGSVYLAKHSTLERMVAVKVLLPEYTQNHEIKNRFINEAKTLSKLSHRNIVTLYDFEQKDGNLFIIMEYVDGVSLDKHITDSYQIDGKQALNIFSQILDGFEYAHNQGIIHRDIKPSNIILQKDNTPKILDFGIAKIIQGDIKLTRTGVKMGSILYMSPEQILGEEVDIRTDIYSLGILLYEMLTQNVPYDIKTNTDYEVMDKILKQEIPLININSNDEIGRIIQKACQKNRVDRYQTLSEFKRDLNQSNLLLQGLTSQLNIKTQIIHNYTSASTATTIESNFHNNSGFFKSNNNKNIFMAVVGVVVIAIILFLILGRSNDTNDVELISNGVVNKKEKETLPLTSTDESSVIKNKTITLLSETEQKNDKIKEYYAPNVNYYKNGMASINVIMSDKRKFFNKWDKIILTPENINITKEGSSKYVCVFDKYFKAYNYSGKFYEGKVKSRLVFEKVNDNWVITMETDDLIYWTNKN